MLHSTSYPPQWSHICPLTLYRWSSWEKPLHKKKIKILMSRNLPDSVIKLNTTSTQFQKKSYTYKFNLKSIQKSWIIPAEVLVRITAFTPTETACCCALKWSYSERCHILITLYMIINQFNLNKNEDIIKTWYIIWNLDLILSI